jgi:hypothetical protein
MPPCSKLWNAVALVVGYATNRPSSQFWRQGYTEAATFLSNGTHHTAWVSAMSCRMFGVMFMYHIIGTHEKALDTARTYFM